MKCRVCGYEIGEDRDYCPMCGTKVPEQAKPNFRAATTEMAWNTKDFPKPKQLEDIEMNWGNGFRSFMAQDASEGFVSVEKTAPVAPKPQFTEKKTDPFELPTQMKQAQQPTFISSQPNKPVYKYQPTATSTPVQPAPQMNTIPQAPKMQPQVQIPQAPQMQQPVPPVRQSAPQPSFDAWKMPPQEEPPMPLWYTQNFTASGVMKTGPAFPLQQPQAAPQPMAPVAPMQTPVMPMQQTQPMPQVQQPVVQTPIMAQPMPQAPVMPQTPVMPQAVTAQQAAAAFSAAVPDATIEFMRVDAPQPVFPQEYIVPTQAQKAPEQFNTFMAKNEEFQALLDKEYARIRASHREDTSPLNSVSKAFSNDTKIKAQPIEDFERSIFDDASPIGAEIKAATNAAASAQAFKPSQSEIKPNLAFAYDKDETSISLEELISDPLSPRFDIDTLELTIKKLELEEAKQEDERKNRQTRLEAMKAAREAYFRFLDGDDATPVKPVKKVEDPKPQPKEESAAKIQADAAPIRFDKYTKVEDPKQEAPVSTEDYLEEPTIEVVPRKPVESVEAANEVAKDETPVEIPSLGAEDADEAPVATAKPAEDSKTFEEEQVLETPKEDPKPEDVIGENNAEEKTLEMDKDYTASLEAKLKELQTSPELDNLYVDDEEEDEPKSHGFLKFLLALIIIIAILVVAVFALEHFLPDSEVTAIAVSIKDAVVVVFQDLVAKIKK